MYKVWLETRLLPNGCTYSKYMNKVQLGTKLLPKGCTHIKYMNKEQLGTKLLPNDCTHTPVNTDRLLNNQFNIVDQQALVKGLHDRYVRLL